MSDRFPDFLIIGEMRCGTTTLWGLLERHPEVHFPERKETHFFSSYAGGEGALRLATGGLAAYGELFAGAAMGQRCGEATPSYLFDPEACERIHEALPDARLLVILRDPVARAWSHYWHQVRRGRESLGFEEALEAEPTRLASGDPATQVRFAYRARGRYVEGLERYASQFGREALCVVFLEELRRDPRPVLETLYAHIGIAAAGPDIDLALPHANRADFPRWPRLDAAIRMLRDGLQRHAPALAGPAQHLGRLTRSFRVYSGAPRLAETTRRDLEGDFLASDRSLAAWLGRELPWRAGASQ
ncbi:MAG: sulfotransferase [Deltaproteobacteria bacterium]|nr:sulfotransferase [Deltaproteobacteria bacterium]